MIYFMPPHIHYLTEPATPPTSTVTYYVFASGFIILYLIRVFNRGLLIVVEYFYCLILVWATSSTTVQYSYLTHECAVHFCFHSSLPLNRKAVQVFNKYKRWLWWSTVFLHQINRHGNLIDSLIDYRTKLNMFLLQKNVNVRNLFTWFVGCWKVS